MAREKSRRKPGKKSKAAGAIGVTPVPGSVITMVPSTIDSGIMVIDATTFAPRLTDAAPRRSSAFDAAAIDTTTLVARVSATMGAVDAPRITAEHVALTTSEIEVVDPSVAEAPQVSPIDTVPLAAMQRIGRASTPPPLPRSRAASGSLAPLSSAAGSAPMAGIAIGAATSPVQLASGSGTAMPAVKKLPRAKSASEITNGGAKRATLRRRLVRELARSEHAVLADTARLAKKLGGAAPGVALAAIGDHAREEAAALALLGGRLGWRAHVGAWASAVGTAIASPFVDVERAYRDALVELRRGLDTARLLRDIALRDRDLAVVRFCDLYLVERACLVEACEQELGWFGEVAFADERLISV